MMLSVVARCGPVYPLDLLTGRSCVNAPEVSEAVLPHRIPEKKSTAEMELKRQWIYFRLPCLPYGHGMSRIHAGRLIVILALCLRRKKYLSAGLLRASTFFSIA